MNLNSIRQQLLERAAGSASFRARLLEDAAAAIREETGFPVPKGISVAAHDHPGDGLQLVVSGATSLSDAQLAEIVGGSGQQGWKAYGYESEEEANAAWQSAFPGSTEPWNE